MAARLVFACLISLAVLAAPARAATVVAVEQGRVHADAYGDRIAWSSFDPQTRVWRLMTAQDGKVVATSAPVSEHPFRLDVGPGPDGEAVAVYPRCSGDAACDLFLYDFATARERRLKGLSTKGASEVLPSVWRSRIAFARRTGAGSQLLLARLDGRGEPARVPGGMVTGPSGPIAVELRGTRIVYVWSRRGSNGFTRTELFAWSRGRTSFLDVTTSGGAGTSTFVTPELRSRHVYYGRPASGRGGGNQLRRVDLRTRRVDAARAPFGGIVTAVWLTDRFLLSRTLDASEAGEPEANCRRPGSEPSASVCRLIVGDRVTRWTRVSGG